MERCIHVLLAFQKYRLSEWALLFCMPTTGLFINTLVLLISSRCYPKRVIFCNFPLQSNCADVPGCLTEELINQTTPNFLWEILQASETTMVRAQRNVIMSGNVRKLKRKRHLEFWCLTMFQVAVTELSTLPSECRYDSFFHSMLL